MINVILKGIGIKYTENQRKYTVSVRDQDGIYVPDRENQRAWMLKISPNLNAKIFCANEGKHVAG